MVLSKFNDTVYSTYNAKSVMSDYLFPPINSLEYISDLVIFKLDFNEKISCTPKISL